LSHTKEAKFAIINLIHPILSGFFMEAIKNFFSAAGQLIVDMTSAIGSFFKNIFIGSSTPAPVGNETAPANPPAPQEAATIAALKELVSDQDRAAIQGALAGTKHTYKEQDKSSLPTEMKHLAATDRSYHPEIGTDTAPIFTQNENGRLVVNMPQNARMEITKFQSSVSMPGQDVQYNVLVAPSYEEMGAAQRTINSGPTSFTAQSMTVTGKMLEDAQMIINTPKLGSNSLYVKRDDVAKGTTLVINSEGADVKVTGASYLLNNEFKDNPMPLARPAVTLSEPQQQPPVVFVEVPRERDNGREKHREHIDAKRARSTYSAPRSRAAQSADSDVGGWGWGSLYDYRTNNRRAFPNGYGR
jgi:hypothetical protein